MFYFNRLLYFPGSVSHTAAINKSRLLCFVELFRSQASIINRLFYNCSDLQVTADSAYQYDNEAILENNAGNTQSCGLWEQTLTTI